MLGSFNGSTTQFYVTDILGSVVTSFNAIAGSAIILGNQLYGPYGNQRYKAGSMGTSKGYTGQYNDSLSGLDYYHARYYDPIIGRFVSADTVEGNPQGLDPYAYVGGNPETMDDPSGHAGGDHEPEYFLFYVQAWYMTGHPGQTVSVDDWAIAGASTSSLRKGLNTSAQRWKDAAKTGTDNEGYPDLVNFTKGVIWEVKTGGGTSYDPNPSGPGKGLEPPKSATIGIGRYEVQFYVDRLAALGELVPDTGKPWRVGNFDADNDPELGAQFAACGGVCVVYFSTDEVMYIAWDRQPGSGGRPSGVLLYWFDKNHRPPRTAPANQPVVVRVTNPQGVPVWTNPAYQPNTQPAGDGWPAFAGLVPDFTPSSSAATFAGGLVIVGAGYYYYRALAGLRAGGRLL